MRVMASLVAATRNKPQGEMIGFAAITLCFRSMFQMGGHGKPFDSECGPKSPKQ